MKEGLQSWPFIPLLLGVVAIMVFAGLWAFMPSVELRFLMVAGITALGMLVLALYVAVVTWVYMDANRIGVPAMPWALVAAFLFIIGLALFLVVREIKLQRRTD